VFRLFFFFQAEDGIRDLIVTGVQTCALPISSTFSSCRRASATEKVLVDELLDEHLLGGARAAARREGARRGVRRGARGGGGRAQIGRASCRGRGGGWGGGGGCVKNRGGCSVR